MYGRKQAVFRKVYHNTRVSIFQGGHEMIHNAALNWLAQQRKDQPANWHLTTHHALATEEGESQSGK